MPLKFTLSSQGSHHKVDLRSEVRLRSNTPSMPRDYNGMSKAEMLLGVSSPCQEMVHPTVHRGLKKKASNMSLLMSDIKNALGNTSRRPSRQGSPLRSRARSTVSRTSSSNSGVMANDAVWSMSGPVGHFDTLDTDRARKMSSTTADDGKTTVTAQVTVPQGQSVIVENLTVQGLLGPTKRRPRLPAQRKALLEKSERGTEPSQYRPAPAVAPLVDIRRLPSERIRSRPDGLVHNTSKRETESIGQAHGKTNHSGSTLIPLYDGVYQPDEEGQQLDEQCHSPLSSSEESSISVHTMTSKVTDDTITPANRLIIQRPSEVMAQEKSIYDLLLQTPISPQSPPRLHRLTGTDLQFESVLSLSGSESESDSDSYGSSFQHKHTSMTSVESDTLPTPKSRKRLSRSVDASGGSVQQPSHPSEIGFPHDYRPPSLNPSVDTWRRNGLAEGTTTFLISTPVEKTSLPAVHPATALVSSQQGPLTLVASTPRIMLVSKSEANHLESKRTRQRTNTGASIASSHLTVPSISHSPPRDQARRQTSRSRSRSSSQPKPHPQAVEDKIPHVGGLEHEADDAEAGADGLGIYNFPAPPRSPQMSRKVSISTLLDAALPESPETVPTHARTPMLDTAMEQHERPQTALWSPVSPTSTIGTSSMDIVEGAVLPSPMNSPERPLSPVGKARRFHLPTRSEPRIKLWPGEGKTRAKSVSAKQEEESWRGRTPDLAYGYEWKGGKVTVKENVAIGEAV